MCLRLTKYLGTVVVEKLNLVSQTAALCKKFSQSALKEDLIYKYASLVMSILKMGANWKKLRTGADIFLVHLY